MKSGSEIDHQCTAIFWYEILYFMLITSVAAILRTSRFGTYPRAIVYINMPIINIEFLVFSEYMSIKRLMESGSHSTSQNFLLC
jgi:hypothetical protein